MNDILYNYQLQRESAGSNHLQKFVKRFSYYFHIMYGGELIKNQSTDKSFSW